MKDLRLSGSAGSSRVRLHLATRDCPDRKAKRSRLTPALLIAVTLACASRAKADRFPANCGLGGDGVGLSVAVVVNQAIVGAGQVVEYRVLVSNQALDGQNDAACEVAEAQVRLRLPNGIVLTVITNATLVAGAPSIICPGDRRCQITNVGPTGFGYPYVVQLADVTNIDFAAECPFPSGTTPALVAAIDYGARIRNTDSGFGSLSVSKCLPLRVAMLRFDPASGLTLFGMCGQCYQIEYAENLTPPVRWEPFTTVTLSADSGVLSETQLMTKPQCFYRALLVSSSF